MTVESVTYISDLNTSYPATGDNISEGENHIQNIKTALKTTFTGGASGLSGAVTASHTELNILDGATLSTAELNLLDGVTATTAELNYTDGVTSNIQTQLDAKAAASTAGRWVTLRSQTASGSAVDFINGVLGAVISNAYEQYRIVLINVAISADATLQLRTTTNASTFDSGASDYAYSSYYAIVSGIGSSGAAADAYIALSGGISFESTMSGGICGEILFFAPSSAVHPRFIWRLTGTAAGGTDEQFWQGAGRRLAAADIDGVRLLLSTGTFSSGTVILQAQVK